MQPFKNVKAIQKAGLGAGASGSFFFFSSDGKLTIKTISRKEIKHMIRMLPNYKDYLDLKNSSFIAKIYGIFTIRMDKFSDLHVMLM